MTITRYFNYADLQKQMHEALRVQHPEWIQPDGASPMCDDYDARFAELLSLFSVTTEHGNSQEERSSGDKPEVVR